MSDGQRANQRLRAAVRPGIWWTGAPWSRVTAATCSSQTPSRTGRRGVLVEHNAQWHLITYSSNEVFQSSVFFHKQLRRNAGLPSQNTTVGASTLTMHAPNIDGDTSIYNQKVVLPSDEVKRITHSVKWTDRACNLQNPLTEPLPPFQWTKWSYVAVMSPLLLNFPNTKALALLHFLLLLDTLGNRDTESLQQWDLKSNLITIGLAG